jgi:KDO2-lipid IV(A) lauroyltransferase
MYYLVYGLLYAFSLLPFFIIYAFSDFVSFVMFHVVGYRKKVVLHNLAIAFPEKERAELNKIARRFYSNLIDTFLETIKLLSLSEKEINKRATMDMTACNAIAAKGKNIQFHSGHQMNWEYGNYAVVNNLSIPWIGVYMRISNKVLDKIFYDLRSKRGTILVCAQEFKQRDSCLFNQQYSLGLAADQNPGIPQHSPWMYFFSKPAPFVSGPEKGARNNNTAVVFVKFVKLKRGYYKFEPTIITEEGASLKDGELTLLYRDFLEATIRDQPDNYLWSHRRWKWDWKPEYEERWIDTRKQPMELVAD